MEFGINKERDFSQPLLESSLDFTIRDKIVDNYVANINYIHSDFSYGLLFYIRNNQNLLLEYDNVWKNSSDSSLSESQNVIINYQKKKLFGASFDYNIYQVDNISLKIGVNFNIIRDKYAINYSHKYDMKNYHTIDISKKYSTGTYINEEILYNTSASCRTSIQSEDLEYLYNEKTDNYEITSGYLICMYKYIREAISSYTENDQKCELLYNINYSPYIMIRMEITKNLYLSAKIGINVYNSLIIGYNKQNIDFEINTQAYSSFYSLSILYHLTF